MKVGDLVELIWYDEIYKGKGIEGFIGIITGFDSTDCAYIDYHNMPEKFPRFVAIPKNRLRVL